MSQLFSILCDLYANDATVYFYDENADNIVDDITRYLNKKVQVGNDQETAQSERDSHSKKPRRQKQIKKKQKQTNKQTN